MYPILKPGAVVKIKKLKKDEESITGCLITKTMAELSGSTVKIKDIYLWDINPLNIRYIIYLDHGRHCWAIDFFTVALLKRKAL